MPPGIFAISIGSRIWRFLSGDDACHAIVANWRVADNKEEEYEANRCLDSVLLWIAGVGGGVPPGGGDVRQRDLQRAIRR